MTINSVTVVVDEMLPCGEFASLSSIKEVGDSLHVGYSNAYESITEVCLKHYSDGGVVSRHDVDNAGDIRSHVLYIAKAGGRDE